MTAIFAVDDHSLSKCYNVYKELRTDLSGEEEFISQAKRQMKESSFRIVYLEDENEVKSAAGFRISENFAWGKNLYVDDLITLEKERSKKYGSYLFDWLVNYAKGNNCRELHLDSGVQRFSAHRFYLNKKMEISSHHFKLKL